MNRGDPWFSDDYAAQSEAAAASAAASEDALAMTSPAGRPAARPAGPGAARTSSGDAISPSVVDLDVPVANLDALHIVEIVVGWRIRLLDTGGHPDLPIAGTGRLHRSVCQPTLLTLPLPDTQVSLERSWQPNHRSPHSSDDCGLDCIHPLTASPACEIGIQRIATTSTSFPCRRANRNHGGSVFRRVRQGCGGQSPGHGSSSPDRLMVISSSCEGIS